VKTSNSTPWCNLYSTASKYNICVKQSQYRNLFWLSACLFFNLLLISYATYAYQLVLVIAVLTIVLMSIIIAKKKNGQLTSLQFTLDEYSVCSFEDAPDNKAENIVVSHVSRKEQFQLLASSRYSFFGCWLHMAPFSHLSSSALLSYAINKKPKNKWLFIYRDSLSTQDFSRLSQAIRKLKDTS
jgi:hypothetical protein